MGKKRKNSRNIGASFENEVKKALNAWGQGNWEFQRAKGGSDERMIGDILAVPDQCRREFPFQVEARKNEEYSAEGLIDASNSDMMDSCAIVRWMLEKEELSRSGKPIWFVMKKNHVAPRIMMRDATWSLIASIVGYPQTSWVEARGADGDVLILTHFNDFLDFLDPNTLGELWPT